MPVIPITIKVFDNIPARAFHRCKKPFIKDRKCPATTHGAQNAALCGLTDISVLVAVTAFTSLKILLNKAHNTL